MIEKICFKDIEKSENFSYAKNLNFFQKNDMLHFSKGLNVIFAPNGAGKSTLLDILAYYTACKQGGISTVTENWMHSIFSMDKNKMDGIDVYHDGQPVVYCNTREMVGLVGGFAGFDYDFFDEGIKETLSKDSTGYKTIARLSRIIDIFYGKKVIPDNIDYRGININEKYIQFLTSKIEKGPKTIIIDEPESGLALHAQYNLFKIINDSVKKMNIQIIMATHSPFILPFDANFIELEPDYIRKVKTLMKEIF